VNLRPDATSRSRAVAAVVLVAAVAGFVGLGGWSWLTGDGNVEGFLTGTGAVGPLLFVVAMWLTQPLGVPGAVYMLPAGAVWPAPTAVALCWIGNLGASWLAFTYARSLARDWVMARIPARLHRYDDQLADGGVLPIVALRVVFGQLPAADWLLGVTKVTTRRFLVGTAIGIVPGILLFVILGGGLLDLWASIPLGAQVGAVVAAGLAMVIRRVLTSRRLAAVDPELQIDRSRPSQ
jgi:uncharacterized membrane protein YdjX (TVP38/TMEM64 family)